MEFAKKVYWLVFTSIFSLFLFCTTQAYKHIFDPFIEINSSVFDNEEIEELQKVVADIQQKENKRNGQAAKLVKALGKKSVSKPNSFFEKLNKNILAIGMDLVNVKNLQIQHKPSLANEFEFADRIRNEFSLLLESEEQLWRVILATAKENYEENGASPIHQATLDEEYGKYNLAKYNYQQSVKNILEEFNSQGAGSYLWKGLLRSIYPLLSIILFFVLIALFARSEEFYKFMEKSNS